MTVYLCERRFGGESSLAALANGAGFAAGLKERATNDTNDDDDDDDFERSLDFEYEVCFVWNISVS